MTMGTWTEVDLTSLGQSTSHHQTTFVSRAKGIEDSEEVKLKYSWTYR